MALVLKDRVKVTTTTTGTGAFAIGGAQFGFQGFSAFANGDTTYYTVVDHATGAWETGVGTYSSTGPTLARTTVLDSSNAGGLVNFDVGPKDLFVVYPAGRAVSTAGNVTLTGPLEVPAGATGAQAVRASEAQWSGAVTVPMSGTAVDVSGIPLAAQEIALVFQNVGIPAAAILVRIGNPAVSAVDYVSISSAVTSSPAVGAALEFTGIAVRSGSANASVVNGGMRILRVGSDNWFDGQLFGNDDFRMITVSGRKYMTGVSVIRLLLTSGVFSGGSVLVRWRY